MKYFTTRLWNGVNNPRTARRVVRQWVRNTRAYQAQLETLLPSFSERNRLFWGKHVYHLHDGTIVQFSVGDAVGCDVAKARPRTWRTEVQMKVIDWDHALLCTLRYGEIQSVTFSARREEPRIQSIFDDWGYSELTRHPKGWLKHTILCSSGAEIEIVFNRFQYRRNRMWSKRTRRTTYHRGEELVR